MQKSNFVARPVQCFPVFNSFLLLNNMFGCNDIMMNDSDWMSVDRLFCQSLLLTNTSFSPKIFRPLRTFCLHFFFAAKTSHQSHQQSSTAALKQKAIWGAIYYLLSMFGGWITLDFIWRHGDDSVGRSPKSFVFHKNFRFHFHLSFPLSFCWQQTPNRSRRETLECSQGRSFVRSSIDNDIYLLLCICIKMEG